MRYYKLNIDGSIAYSCTTKPVNEETLYLEEAPTKYHKWDGSKWGEDSILKTEFDKNEAKKFLLQSDSGIIRIIEDLVGILINKNVITEKDLPSEVIDKLNERKTVREKLKN